MAYTDTHPFQQQLTAVEKWLDNAANVTRLPRHKKGETTYEWVLDIEHPLLAGTKPYVVLPRGFPLRPAQIRVAPRLCLVLPHVEETGSVCLGVDARAEDVDYPTDAVSAVIDAFNEFLRHCEDRGWVEDEFNREASDYWWRYCQKNGAQDWPTIVRCLYVNVAPFDSYVDSSVALYTKSQRGVSGFGTNEPATLARRHGLGGGTEVNGNALYVRMHENQRWTPNTWPRSYADLDTLVSQATGNAISLREWWLNDPKKNLSPTFVLIVSAGLVYAYQLFRPILPKVTPPTIAPLRTVRIDASWSLTRDQAHTTFALRKAKRLLVLGCGSLGSPVVELLARAGIGHIDVVDYEPFSTENCARHVLGMTVVGENKAVAMASRTQAEIPDATIKGYDESCWTWMLGKTKPGTYDIVVDCTGESGIRALLTHWRRHSLDDVPLVHAWLEPFCAAAHVTVLVPGDEWPAEDPADAHIHAADWPSETRVNLPACGAGFHPYSAADVQQAAGFTVERILTVLDHERSPSTIWSWVRSRKYIESLGVNAVPRDIAPDAPSTRDSVCITRAYREVVPLAV